MRALEKARKIDIKYLTPLITQIAAVLSSYAVRIEYWAPPPPASGARNSGGGDESQDAEDLVQDMDRMSAIDVLSEKTSL